MLPAGQYTPANTDRWPVASRRRDRHRVCGGLAPTPDDAGSHRRYLSELRRCKKFKGIGKGSTHPRRLVHRAIDENLYWTKI